MKTRRIIALLLSVLMLLSLLAGCSGKTEADQASTKGTENAASAEKPTIVFAYPVLVFSPTEEGTVAVEKELNAYLDGIGANYQVDLQPIDGTTYANQVDMALLGNTQIDIYCPFSGLGQAVSGHKLQSLNKYLDNELKDTVDIMGERYLTSSTVDGECYAIPCYKGQVLIDYWVVRKDVFDQTGLDPYATYDLAAIEDALGKMQAVEPDIPAIAARIGNSGTGNSLNLQDYLGGVGNYEATFLTGGAVVFGQSTEVVNYYESEMFEEAVRTAYRWNQAGYVPKEASLTTESASIDKDQVLSFFITYGYDRPSVESASVSGDYETYAIPVAEQVFTSNFLYWGISHSCKNPDEAANFLNLLYTDETVLNLVIFGIEGEDYVVTDDSGIVKAIDWPEGLSAESVPYTAFLSCGILGNQFIMHAMNGSTAVSDVEFMAEKMENATYSPIFGFPFDTQNVENQISACTNVIAQYSGGLLCGELDPDQYLPKFRSELKTAGVDDIIAEAQKQIDAWLAEQN